VNVVVFIEPGDDLSLQALTIAQQLGDVRAVTIEGGYQPSTWAAALAEQEADAFVAAGSDRGNELLAHVAARLDRPCAARRSGSAASRAGAPPPAASRPSG